MRNVRGTLVGLLAAFLLPACSGQGGESQMATPAGEPTQIVIDNRSFSTVEVFLMFDGQKHRLEQVFGTSRVTVRIPRFVSPVGSIQVLVDPLGDATPFLSDPVSYLATEDFLLTIREPLGLSSFIAVAR